MLNHFETEMNILHKLSFDDLEAVVGEKNARNIINAREGKMKVQEGGGGIYGKIGAEQKLKKLLITEKPSVAMEFAKVLKLGENRRNGYIENEEWIITWCVGHLVTMSYPEVYDEKLKFWRLDTLPFIPEEFKYEIIPAVAKQFEIVKGLLQREDVDEIYNARRLWTRRRIHTKTSFYDGKTKPKS